MYPTVKVQIESLEMYFISLSAIRSQLHCKYMHWKYSRRALFCVIFEKITRIYLLSQVHEKSAINTHFMCNLIAVYLCKFYTRRNVISTLG